MAPAKELAERLGLHFDDLTLLSQALIHSSYIHEQPSTGLSNERLEFLGDAVISLIVSETLFERYPDEDEGSLTTRRAEIVSARGLARIAQRLELDRLPGARPRRDGGRRAVAEVGAGRHVRGRDRRDLHGAWARRDARLVPGGGRTGARGQAAASRTSSRPRARSRS